MTNTNTSLPSTTWEWRRVKIGRPAGGQEPSAAKPLRWFHRSQWNWRKPLTMTMKYRGGAECWIEVHSRGSSGRFPGHAAIVDVLAEITRNQR